MVFVHLRGQIESALQGLRKSRAALTGALVLLSTIVFVAVVLRFGLDERWSATDPRHIGKGDTLDAWFTPQGDLIRLGQEESRVTVDYWTSGRFDASKGSLSPTRRVFDIGKELGIQALPRLSWGNLETTGAGEIIPYAVSEDGSILGWVWGEDLYLRRVHDRPDLPTLDARIPLGVDSVSAFCFLPDNAVAIITSREEGGRVKGGELSSWSLLEKAPSRWQQPLPSAYSRLWTRGSTLALSVFSTGDLLLASNVSWKHVETQMELVEADIGAVLSVTPSGGLVVGTLGGGVRFLVDQDWSVYLDVNQPVRAISYFGDHVAVGGDFSGVRFLANGRRPMEVLDGPSGIRVLAAFEPYLVYANRETTDVVRLSKVHLLNELGLVYLALYSTVLSLIAVLHAIDVDRSSARGLPKIM